MKQRTEEWFAGRVGRITASRFRDVLATKKAGTKTVPAKAREDYMLEKVCERLTGALVEHYVTPAMERGLMMEADARRAYEFARDASVEEVGLLVLLDNQWIAASPDGLIGADGCLEIKCPGQLAHMRTLQGGIPAEHVAQVQGQLWVSGRAWCDFVSYHPAFPAGLSLYVQRIERDEAYIAQLREQVFQFNEEISAEVAAMRARLG